MENIIVKSSDILEFAGKIYRCVLGENGVAIDKTEGDGKTPLGIFAIRSIYFRNDKLAGVDSVFPARALTKDDGWSDDVNDPSNYNRFVNLPYEGSHENLWREDDIYDIIVVLGYNDDPPIVGKGSAIFMHIARPEFTKTAGCIALSKPDLLEILSKINTETQVEIV